MLILRTSIGRFEPSAQMGPVRPVNFLAMSDKSKYTLAQQNLTHTRQTAVARRREAMSDPVLRGSCLCKAVRYEVRPPFIRFAHCYCSRCRKATGGVRATNIAVVPDQFRWVSGEELISRYDLPEARSFARQICKRCNCPVPHKSRGGEQVIVPAGTLDDDPGSKPSGHRNWGSRVGWATVDESHLPVSE